ncbi:hypothetical protein [Oligoflexus tunisiensis]|uniref:hypothetical protein n=1 Tax=Oligoflexus tunisiensis TaxID=708132 RepID=UPI00114CF3B2|nr:hypothetical protein [Oligoflexus tunisiensis]
MLSKMLLTCLALTVTSSVWANTLDFNVTARKGQVNNVDWNGTELGFSYLFDLNDAIAVGPYLSTTRWDISNDDLKVDSKADDREFGPEIRFVAPLETLEFLAGASYSLVSKGTAETEGGQTADLAVRGLRFKIGLGLPFESGAALNFWLVKGLQEVEVKAAHDKAHEDLDDIGLALSLGF